MTTDTKQPFDVLGVLLQWQLRSQDTDGQYCALLATVPPQCMVPPHQHVEQEAFFMLEGTGEFAQLVDGKLQWKQVAAPEMINIPSDSVHGFRNSSDRDIKCLITAHPRIEEFFLEAAAPVPSQPSAPSAGEVERVLAIARKHGQRFLAPDTSA